MRIGGHLLWDALEEEEEDEELRGDVILVEVRTLSGEMP